MDIERTKTIIAFAEGLTPEESAFLYNLTYTTPKRKRMPRKGNEEIQKKVKTLLAQGKTNKEVAKQLKINYQTLMSWKRNKKI